MMQLEELHLKNFRQFEDERIEFSTDDDKNVTVIHGQNGSGKTTLLNAFKWVLYGEVDFEGKQTKLANEGAIAKASPGAKVEVKVKLEFADDGNKYRAVRTKSYRKHSSEDQYGKQNDIDFKLLFRDHAGNWTQLSEPQKRVSQIIPDRLSNLFFFDGEDIEKLAGVNNQEEIRKAIRNIMGLTILERSIRHLGNVADEFEEEYRDNASQAVEELFAEKDKLDKQIDHKNNQISEKESEKKECETSIKTITKTLENLEDSKELEAELQQKNQRISDIEEQIARVENDIKDRITKSGCLAFALPILRQTAEDLEELQKNDFLESEVSTDFLDSLLERRKCVCGRPLEKHSKYYERIQELKPEVAAGSVGETAVQIVAAVEHATDDYETLQAQLTEELSELEELRTKRQRLTDRIEEIEEELEELTGDGDDRDQSPAELTAERKEWREKRDTIIEDIGKLEQQLEELEAERAEIEAELQAAREEQEKAELAKRRWKAAKQTQAELEATFEEFQDIVRELADERVTELIDAIAHKDLRAEINSDFELIVEKRNAGGWTELLRSTGETQITSLAFIGSLVAIAREQYEDNNDAKYFTGGIYPIVMDSPFGTLDSDHREQIARIIPELGNQIVVMVTDTQWEGAVAREMRPAVGKEYSLDYEDGTADESHPVTRIKSGVYSGA